MALLRVVCPAMVQRVSGHAPPWPAWQGPFARAFDAFRLRSLRGTLALLALIIEGHVGLVEGRQSRCRVCSCQCRLPSKPLLGRFLSFRVQAARWPGPAASALPAVGHALHALAWYEFGRLPCVVHICLASFAINKPARPKPGDPGRGCVHAHVHDAHGVLFMRPTILWELHMC